MEIQEIFSPAEARKKEEARRIAWGRLEIKFINGETLYWSWDGPDGEEEAKRKRTEIRRSPTWWFTLDDVMFDSSKILWMRVTRRLEDE